MGPFDFIIMFFSFAYALALTHILFAATRMIRHRKVLIFSWPHALWMLAALCQLLANWITLWDFRTMKVMPISIVLIGFVIVAVVYFICALVAPDFEDGDSYDLRAFHANEGSTYIAAFLVLTLLSLAINFAAGVGAGIQNWADQNLLVLAMIPVIVLALFVKARWVQVTCPLAMIAAFLFFLGTYYPVLA